MLSTGAGLRRVSWVLAPLVALSLFAGCTENPPEPAPPTTTSTPREFTVATTQRLSQLDPASVTTDAGSLVATAVFQRLMTLDPSKNELRPDAASDCLFQQPTVYECTLRDGLTFHNGNPLSASDVKYSIERTISLGATTGAKVLFSSLERIEVPNQSTVRFRLKWADTEFAFALATPQASIVDEANYPLKTLRSDDLIPIGSGPYRLGTRSGTEALFSQFLGYSGATPSKIGSIRVATYADSSSVEEAMIRGTADVAWRALDEPAVTRLRQQIDGSSEHTTQTGWTSVSRTGLNVQRLAWNPSSTHRLNAALRTRVSLALQSERTLDSIVPRGVDGHVAAFPLGGVPTLPTAAVPSVSLTLSYDAGQPGAEALAGVIRSRLLSTGKISVEVKANDDSADLVLSNALPPLALPSGWLLSYLSSPLPGSAAKLQQLGQRVRTTADANARLVALSELQQQAAADNTVIPVSQTDDALFLASGVRIADDGFGSGWQLTLWGLER